MSPEKGGIEHPKTLSRVSIVSDRGNRQLGDIVDAQALHSLMDDFYTLTRIPVGLLDLDGKVLSGAGWQRVCTEYHRKHPQTLRHCIESDTRLTAGIQEGKYRLYKCMNNMWDAATPVLVDSRLMGHLFAGQFFFDDELPDYDVFRAQAARYGFTEEDYLAAIEAAPRVSRATLDRAMSFLMKLATMISQLSYSNIELTRTLAERESLMHSLEKSKQRLARAQEIAHLGSWELDLVNNDLTWSDEVYRIFGLEPQQFAATYEAFLEAVHPDDRAAVNDAYSGSLREGRDSYEIEHRIVRKTGEVRYVHEKCEHFRNESGEIIRSVGMVHDITDRKQIETSLREAKTTAEAATRAKSEFLANMSHEIRTPMNAIIGMTELTLDTSLTRQQRDYLEMVQSSAESLLKVINDILDFSKIEAGLLEFDTAPFDLRDLVEKTAHTLALRAHQKGLELACRVDPAVPSVLMGDDGRLRQVLTNLIGNAIKFTEAGEIVVQVELISPPHDGRCSLHISVSDTGIGIPAHKMNLLFRYFSQVDSSSTRRFEGTGLGLAISQQIVEKMGGNIQVDSAEGEGSTFHFTAPFSLPQQASTARPPLAKPDLEGMRVLIIDDNETNRYILTEMLTSWGMAPSAVASGLEGIVRLRMAAKAGKPFRLLLLDERMPQMDGFTVAQKIRSDATLPEVNIMMLSSGDIPAAVERCREVGIETYLVKPLRQSELFDTLMETFGQRHLSGDLTDVPSTDLAESAPTSHSARILLAEDNRINQTLARTLLEKRGWSVLTASTGKEALNVWRTEKVDLILMDVQMPEVDGLQATRLIREEEAALGAGRTPIIGLTAHAMAGDREVCLDAGMDDYVPKPVRAEVLYDAVERLLPGEDDAPAIDLSYILQAVNDDRTLLGELAAQFLRDCPVSCEELKSALFAQDLQKVERTVHTLKSVVGIFGAEKAQSLLSKMENAAHTRELKEMKKLLPLVLQEVGRVQKSLTDFGGEPELRKAGAKR